MSTYGFHNYSSISSGELSGFLAGFLAIIGVIILISCAIGVFHIIGTWKILKKADKPGWGALIPFYNTYLLCTIAGVNPWWIVIVICSPILSIIPVLGSLASAATSIYFMVLLNVSLARSFGKDDGYAVGLILLQPFFYFALGIGQNEYKGPNPMNDFIFKDNNNQPNVNSQQSNNNQQNQVRYCTGCGAQIDQKTKFCPKCGQEVK